jgi:hypothetical protein
MPTHKEHPKKLTAELHSKHSTALMRWYEVSSRVNLVKNNDVACPEPVMRDVVVGMQ